MDSSTLSQGESVKSTHHRIWTRQGPTTLGPGRHSSSTDLGSVTDDSDIDFQTSSRVADISMAAQQDSLLAAAGDLEQIMSIVSSFWDDQDNSAPVLEPSYHHTSLLSDLNQVGVAGSRCSSLFSLKEGSSATLSSGVGAAASVSSRIEAMSGSQTNAIPQGVRMITYSDAVPRPDLPSIPAHPVPALVSSFADSPLALLKAASGGKLDLQWLETFDNATLDTLVPRDPTTNRPLTIGSIEHSEGKCRPCIFFLKAKCFKGLRCSFCHFNHTTLRKQIFPAAEDSSGMGTLDLESLLAVDGPLCSVSVQQPPVTKSKRLRPSKRTREMIKQINEQMMFDGFPEDLNGPPLSVSETLPSITAAPVLSTFRL